MSEVTRQEKTKDPRRVEAGKRLAAISKQAKERKARERLELERRCEAETSTGYGAMYAIGLLAIVVLGGGAYLRFKLQEAAAQNEPKTEPKTTNFISFDE